MANDNLQLSEMVLLARILEDTSGNTMLNVITQLQPEDFADSRNRLIYQAFIALSNKQQVIDIPNTISELTNNKTLDAVGGEEYLNLIVEKNVNVTPIDDYISNIKDRSLLDKFIKTIDHLSSEAKEKPINDISDFIGKAENEILNVTNQRRVEEVSNMNTLTDNLVDSLVKFSAERGNRTDGIVGLESGYHDLDLYTRGWEKGDMIVIGARPSVGKTAFALNLLYNVAKVQEKPVLFFSLEMGSLPITMRLLSLASQCTTDEIYSLTYLQGSTKHNLRLDNLDDRKIVIANNLRNGLLSLSGIPFYLDRNPGSSILDIAAKIKKVKNQLNDLALVAIDYLGLIQAPNRRSENRQTEVMEISRQIKQIANQVQVPIIVLSQLNRQTESRDKKKTEHRPQMSDLRDSGSIEQDADKILMLYRADYYSNGEEDPNLSQDENNGTTSTVEVSLQKNRNGRIGNFKFIFDKEHGQFSVATSEYEQ